MCADKSAGIFLAEARAIAAIPVALRILEDVYYRVFVQLPKQRDECPEQLRALVRQCGVENSDALRDIKWQTKIMPESSTHQSVQVSSDLGVFRVHFYDGRIVKTAVLFQDREIPLPQAFVDGSVRGAEVWVDLNFQ